MMNTMTLTALFDHNNFLADMVSTEVEEHILRIPMLTTCIANDIASDELIDTIWETISDDQIDVLRACTTEELMGGGVNSLAYFKGELKHSITAEVGETLAEDISVKIAARLTDMIYDQPTPANIATTHY